MTYLRALSEYYMEKIKEVIFLYLRSRAYDKEKTVNGISGRQGRYVYRNTNPPLLYKKHDL